MSLFACVCTHIGTVSKGDVSTFIDGVAAKLPLLRVRISVAVVTAELTSRSVTTRARPIFGVGLRERAIVKIAAAFIPTTVNQRPKHKAPQFCSVGLEKTPVFVLMHGRVPCIHSWHHFAALPLNRARNLSMTKSPIPKKEIPRHNPRAPPTEERTLGKS